jgi:O-antigen ligase
MRKFFDRIDELGGVNCEKKSAMWLERIAFVFLILMILSAPHSIAATQTAWLLGSAAWLVRLFIKPRPKLSRTPLDIALWAFFSWTVITSVFSYAPGISFDKLRGALIFLVFYFVINNLRNVRAAKFLAFALVFSCMASVVWSPIERIYGRGVEIYGVGANSLFSKAVHFDHDTYLKAKGKNLPENSAENELKPLVDGDTIVEANGKKIRTPDDLVDEIEKSNTTYLESFNPPDYFTRIVKRENLLDGASSLEKLGINNWKHSRNWRYGGFYGHIITYAEVLQMIASLILGLFIAGFGRRGDEESPGETNSARPFFQSLLWFFSSFSFLFFCLLAMIFALLTTYTRSAQIGFLVSAIGMILVYGSRKMLLISAIIILPLTIAGAFLLQQNRNPGFEKKDESVIYRQTVYSEGFNLWTQDTRKFLLGVGMDSTKRFAKEWHLFDNGRLPAGHFHSTPLQLLVERGLPALILWFWILGIYAQILLRNIKLQIPDSDSAVSNSKSKIQNSKSGSWQAQGILLGCFGGLIGFFVSSAVNYSLGDGEVAMVFFILMGIGVSVVFQNSKSDAL